MRTARPRDVMRKTSREPCTGARTGSRGNSWGFRYSVAVWPNAGQQPRHLPARRAAGPSGAATRLLLCPSKPHEDLLP